jgi:GntR family transcriptional regulator
MILKIEPTSPKPVYQQIVDQVRYALAAGILREGDRLDTIREVAVQLRINRHTVAKAYMELEREGVLCSRPGQGSFISGGGCGPGKVRARKQISPALDDLLAQAHMLGLSEEDVLELVRERLDKVNLKGN